MPDLTRDHVELDDTFAARRYFAKFDAITGHLARVAVEMEADGQLSRADTHVLADYVAALGATFEALSMKYLMTGRAGRHRHGALEIDRVESGFPVFRELMTMANDAAQARRHLDGMPGRSDLLDRMLRQILTDHEIPTRLQYAMSQRLYYEALERGGLFWAQNDPQAVYAGKIRERRLRYLVHWGVYDSQLNLPVIYLMEVEDSGDKGLARDEARWPRLQSHLMAQSLGGLKLVTIARGIDTDFDTLHPKRLRRIHVGPMYSAAYTRQAGPIRAVLEDARAPAGADWALAWTVEELKSARVTEERSGWFGTVEREIYALDPLAVQGGEAGLTERRRALILPQRPFQVLSEKNPPGFRDMRKYVVGAGGRVLAYG